MLIPIFQRQSTVLRLAYAHAMILANRQSLLSNFADLSRQEHLPPEELQGSTKECIDAAMLVVDTVNEFIDQGKMRRAFWFTHYVSFCAIATLYVYTIQTALRHDHRNTENGPGEGESKFQFFEAADKCQKNIFETTVSTSPFRRYNIILDELKREVLLRLRNVNQPAVAQARPDRNGQAFGQPGQSLESSGDIPTRNLNQIEVLPNSFTAHSSFVGQDVQSIRPQTYWQADMPNNIQQSAEFHGELFDGPILDPRLFGQEGNLVGWSEFDACVSAIQEIYVAILTWEQALNWPEVSDWNM